jgi:hypothetical protein
MSRLNRLRDEMVMQPCGEDRISKDAAAVWNDRLVHAPDSHANRLVEYVQAVHDLGQRLEDAAKHYGYTEDEIAASFRSPSARI